jgi:hemin uptake protein HemP
MEVGHAFGHASREIAGASLMSDSSTANDPGEPSSAPERFPSNQPAETPHFESSSLFRGGRMMMISHAGATYRLLLTRNNRLILQK